MANIVRRIHQARSVEDREFDESRLELMTNDEQQWISAPNEFDFKCVDEPLDPHFEKVFRKTAKAQKQRHVFGQIIDEQRKRVVAELKIDCTPHFKSSKKAWDDSVCDLTSIRVDRDVRKKCFANILLREATKWADDNQIVLTGLSSPFGVGEINSPETVDKLTKLYFTYGFKKIGGIMQDEPSKLFSQLIIRIPQTPIQSQ